jgi:hypothetical protein
MYPKTVPALGTAGPPGGNEGHSHGLLRARISSTKRYKIVQVGNLIWN